MDTIQQFLYDLKQNAEPDCVLFLVGNKIDLLENNENLRQVSINEAKNFARMNNCQFIETSAASGSNVYQAFEQLLECKKLKYFLGVYQVKQKEVQYDKRKEDGTITIKPIDKPNKPDDSCCS